MKKRGFTLAEVLITLGIIGVVAALTAPSLVMSSRNQSNAAKLAVIVSNLENAFTNAIVQEDVDDLCKTRMWVQTEVGFAGPTRPGIKTLDISKFVGNLNRYIHLNGFEIINASTFYGDAGGPYTLTETGGKGDYSTAMDRRGNYIMTGDTRVLVYTKSGAVLFMRPSISGDVSTKVKTQDAAADLGGSLYKRAIDLYIDVNGKAAPNTYGRDIFRFYVGSDGILYPYGGLDTSIFDAGNKTKTWNATASGGASSAGDTSCLDGKISGGLGCTARVIAEGYKINY